MADITDVVVVDWGLFLAKEKQLTQQIACGCAEFVWHRDGPRFPLEFSRKTAGGVLPVIDHSSSVQPTFWTRLPASSLPPSSPSAATSCGCPSSAAVSFPGVRPLLGRLAAVLECADDACCIGWYSLAEGSSSPWSQPATVAAVRDWCASPPARLQAELASSNAVVVWCDLGADGGDCCSDLGSAVRCSCSCMKEHASVFAVDLDTPLRRAVEDEYLHARRGNEDDMSVWELYDQCSTLPDELARDVQRRVYFGRRRYAQYIAGNLPVVLAAPHGGCLKPDEIADRTAGCIDGDVLSAELAVEVFNAMCRLCSAPDTNGGHRMPHLIINHLDRTKLDANRNMAEAANGQQWAEQAWSEFQNFIEIAKRRSVAQAGVAHFFDIHGHSVHGEVMVGHLIRAADLERDVAHVCRCIGGRCSLRSLADLKSSCDGQLEILTGPTSIAGLLEAQGFACTPSGSPPFDFGGVPFYNGGYNTWRHGSARCGGRVNATQLETPISVRSSRAARRAFGEATANAIVAFFETHYNIKLRPDGPEAQV
eukprot:TRINITY_DN31558_c0_g1_i1.p1 TRINITY_DN31558_c0_g1~~TRINITY_DN31558_c0_g1_i1.p1  ORF type:complete len:537 (+),score=132.97 TRINITY_DN31558_c0_g1_i1:32-1642(+)